jgi:NAD(P)-dependent dehydrogenase (short-subunit alcohol dehydrogenase family)
LVSRINEQRVALVSGANRGIGRAIARQLSSEHGFLVLAGARDPGRVDLSRAVVAVALDVTDAASVDAGHVGQGADTAAWLATVDRPPTGGFFRDRKPIPW